MKITEKQIKDYHAQAEGYLKRDIEKDYPEVFKVDLWDKWLVDDTEPGWMAFYNKEQNQFTATYSDDKWIKKETPEDPHYDQNNKPATHEQILEMLSKEAVKRGYKDGNHECLLGHTVAGKKTGFVYYANTDHLYFNGNCIFNNGTWAAIIEPVYEWKYLIKDIESKEFAASIFFYTSKKEVSNKGVKAISKIKETKRLRK